MAHAPKKMQADAYQHSIDTLCTTSGTLSLIAMGLTPLANLSASGSDAERAAVLDDIARLRRAIK